MVEPRAQAAALPVASSERVVIAAHSLVKTYQYHRQRAGLRGAFGSLLHREYQTRVAVKGIDFAVHAGEIVGLLGPNGAGKTTTLKMLTGLLHPTDGRVDVLGYQPARRDTEFLRRIALVMGQKTMLWWDVSAMESLLLHKEMYGQPAAFFRDSVDELADLLDVHALLDIQVRRLSLGERMKLELMAALLHRPEVLFLDEPTIGLDVVAKARVRTFLADVNRVRGTTIVITSHDMDDIEALCQRVVIMTNGEIEYDGDLPQLVRTIQPRKRVRVIYGSPVTLEHARAHLPPSVVVPERDATQGEGVLLIEAPRDDLSETLARLPQLGAMLDLDVTDTDVDEIIRELFTRRVATGQEVGS